MSRAQHDMSAKDFKDPLLVVLGALSKYTANKPVKFRDTYDPVCAKVGISVDEFGSQASTGKLWVTQWIGWAFRELKSEGYTTYTKKGYWELTPAGVVQAKSLDESKAPTTPAARAPALVLPSPTEEVTDTTPAPVPVSEEKPYEPDSYVLSIAANNGPKCYGHYSERSQMCEQCLLSAACQNQRHANLSALAVSIRSMRSWKSANRPKESDALDRLLNPHPKQSGLSSHLNPIPAHHFERCRAGMDSKCLLCHGDIKEEDPTVWVKHESGYESGAYHPQCFEKSFEIKE